MCPQDSNCPSCCPTLTRPREEHTLWEARIWTQPEGCFQQSRTGAELGAVSRHCQGPGEGRAELGPMEPFPHRPFLPSATWARSGPIRWA